MYEFILSVLERIVGRLKGSPYRIDRKIPPSTIFSIFSRRLFSIIRSLRHGYSVRSNIFIGKDVHLHGRKLLTLSSGTTIGDHCHIDALSENGIKTGRNVNIGPYSRLEASGTISDIGKGIEIGDNTGIGGYAFIGGAGGVKIGTDVIMGQWVSFHPENHVFADPTIPIRLQGVHRQGITIEDDCWIGAKVTFLDGTHVGRGCVIAAGAVVRGTIPPYSIAGGVPARVIRSRIDQPIS